MSPPAPAAVIVRRAAPADLPGIVERWRELMALHAALDRELFALAPHAPQTYGATVRAQMADRGCLVLVAAAVAAPGTTSPDPTAERAVEGYLTAGVGQRAPIYAHRDIGMVFDLAVRAERRGEGIGKALLGEAEAWFRRRGVAFAQVDYAPGNAAGAQFWQRRGYSDVLAEAYRRL